MELITKGVDITPFSSVMSLNVLLLQVIAVIHSFVSIYGCVLLLKWNRSGFYIILSLQPIVSLVQAYGFYLVQQEYLQLGLSVYPMAAIAATIIMTIISIAILFGILQLRKNGVSYWSQLNQTVPTVNKVILETPTIQTAHKSQSNQASQTEQKTLISQEPATIDRANFKWGKWACYLSIFALIRMFLGWGHMGMVSSLRVTAYCIVALVMGIVCICRRNGENKILAIISIIVSLPILLISLLCLLSFVL